MEAAKPMKQFFRFAMRWKLLAAFAGAFTVVFLILAFWVLQFTTNTAEQRLINELHTTAVGGANVIDAAKFTELVTTVAAVKDPSNPMGLGYPDSPLYKNLAQLHMDVHNIVENASPYSYFKDPADGKLYAAASYGYLASPQFGVPFKVPMSEVVDAYTLDLMDKGITATTDQPVYTDAYGQWISTYTPILDADGNSVGGFGVDLPFGYVNDTRSALERQVYLVLGVMYILLLALVLGLSTSLVRPLKRLTGATKRIADGEYDLDVRGMVRTRFPDEMFELAESFGAMADKIAARERSLTREVQRLKVEIDQTRREEAVREITDNDDFAQLAVKAAEMRARLRKDLGKE
jgi:hypothetical protein